jgi:hypothetical protein
MTEANPTIESLNQGLLFRGSQAVTKPQYYSEKKRWYKSAIKRDITKK